MFALTNSTFAQNKFAPVQTHLCFCFPQNGNNVNNFANRDSCVQVHVYTNANTCCLRAKQTSICIEILRLQKLEHKVANTSMQTMMALLPANIAKLKNKVLFKREKKTYRIYHCTRRVGARSQHRQGSPGYLI